MGFADGNFERGIWLGGGADILACSATKTLPVLEVAGLAGTLQAWERMKVQSDVDVFARARLICGYSEDGFTRRLS